MSTTSGELGGAGEREHRQAPNLDIGEVPVAHRARLELKLAEYAERDRRAGMDGYVHPDFAFMRRGQEIFKAPVLDYVIRALEVPGRDFTSQPITFDEVASAIERLFSIDLSVSKITDFVWNTDRPDTVRPDFDTLYQNEATKYDYAFSEVYAVIRSYCLDGGRGVVGGTGIPELPYQSE
jgi:hypothetical protein